ncbi:MAG: UvrD-helicase domain-containing protein [Planctomycetota bacterium]
MTPSITKAEILESLNPEQKDAVEQIEGPLLILAGPGSGKTRVITHRMANIIASGIPSHQIAALTFTNKAANEMRDRLGKIVPGNRAWTGTFHKFCARLLRQYASLVGLAENFTIYDSKDSRQVIKQAIENSEVDVKHYSVDMLANQISSVKNRCITVDQFQPRPGHAVDAILARVYPEYQKLLQMVNGVDFDDLLLHCVQMLTDAKELREQLDLHYAYMLVDEYQDTNLAQYQLIRLLNHSIQNLAVTGDPDQSIYGWRGADIRNILEFERDYPKVKIVRLEQNYRSTQRILHVADCLIQNNSKRKKKSLITENEEGNPVRLVTYPSPEEESIDIADSIALAVEKGDYQPKDFCILYRANWLSRSLEHSLRSVGIPYQIVNGHAFYQRREIKDMMAYLHLINNPRDGVAFERIVNVPPRKIGKITVGRLRKYAHENSISMLDAARNIDEVTTISNAPSKKLKAFVAMFDRLAFMPTDEVGAVMRSVLDETEYRDWLTQDGSEDGFERANNVDELVVAGDEFDRDHGEQGGLESYLEQASLVADTDVWESEADYVTLMTMHAAKGLEFPCVFIVGLEDGILPHERSSSDDNEIEEERRLLFVVITRAKKELQFSRCLNRYRRGSYWPAIASRFLMELPRAEMDIFEPSKPSFGTDDLADAIDQLDPWGDDELPSYDINDDSSSDSVKEESTAYNESVEHNNSVSLDLSNGIPAEIPGMVTGSQFAVDQEAKFSGQRLPPEDYRLGMQVEHPEYGEGLIVGLTGHGPKRTAEIEFETQGKKTFRLAFVNLRLIA